MKAIGMTVWILTAAMGSTSVVSASDQFQEIRFTRKPAVKASLGEASLSQLKGSALRCNELDNGKGSRGLPQKKKTSESSSEIVRVDSANQ